MKHCQTSYQKRIQDSANLIPKSEPVLLIRATDPYSAQLLAYYADLLETAGEIGFQKIRNQGLSMRTWCKMKVNNIAD